MNQSTVYTIIGITSDMINVFPRLREIIKESESYDNPMKYYTFRAGSVRGQWFAKNYLSERRVIGLKNSLKSLAKGPLSKSEATIEAAGLELNMYRDTSSLKEITGNKHFQNLEFLLPTVLEEMCVIYPTQAASLRSLANRLRSESEKTQAMFEAAFKPSADKPKAEKSDVLSKQNAAVEAVINSVLSGLDQKVAHNIRSLLARSDNKLALLQAELAKLSAV